MTRRFVGTAALSVFALVVAVVLLAPGAAFAADAPTITGIAPAAAPSSGGTSVVISGTGFTDLAATSAVTFGGVDAAGYTLDSDTQITAVTPAHSAGTVRVKVTAAAGETADTASDDFTFMNRYDDTDSHLTYAGAWTSFSKGSAFGGAYHRANSSAASVTMTFSGTRLDWIAMKGTSTGKADVYLDGVFKDTIDLASSTALYKQDVWTTGTVASGTHKVKITWTSTNVSGKYITIDAVDVVGSLVKSGRVEQTDTSLAYAGAWSTFSTSGASSGSYKRASAGGAALTVDFNGTSLAWIATRGTTMGKAWVSLDGGAAENIDLSATAVAYQQKVWETGPLSLGDHEVRIWWDTTNASGKYISVDAFDMVGTLTQAYVLKRYEQSDSRLLYSGTWSTSSATSASGGSDKRGNTSSAILRATFTGSRLDWIATIGPTMGKADVSVDGGPAVTVDLLSATTAYQQNVWSTGTLTATMHTIEITLNETSPSGAYIDLDAFDVLGTLPTVGSLTALEIKCVEQRLADLSYRPGSIDGVIDSRTRGAVIAFQKWEGLTRDGVIGSAVWARLQTAKRPTPTQAGATDPWIEVDKTKQVLLFCKDGKVVWTIPVSTGSASVGVITPAGSFAVYIKTLEISPCYLPCYVTVYKGSMIAIHGYPNVPTYAASHGCVRTQLWDQDAIYPLISLGTKVYIY